MTVLGAWKRRRRCTTGSSCFVDELRIRVLGAQVKVGMRTRAAWHLGLRNVVHERMAALWGRHRMRSGSLRCKGCRATRKRELVLRKERGK